MSVGLASSLESSNLSKLMNRRVGLILDWFLWSLVEGGICQEDPFVYDVGVQE